MAVNIQRKDFEGLTGAGARRVGDTLQYTGPDHPALGENFKSTVQTGTGSEQSIEHGLGRTPSLVLVIPASLTGGTDDFTEGTHTSTYVKVTASTGAKYIVLAF